MSVTAIEEAPFVNIYGRGTAQRLLARLGNGATKLDEAEARKIANREGVSVIISGSIAHKGTGYEIAVRAIDAATGKVISTNTVEAAGDSLVLHSIGRLLAPIRTALGDTTSNSTQLAASETYTSNSLAAAHAYALGQESLGTGKQDDAVRYYEQAVQLDPNFGRAYTGLAVVHFNLKDLSKADSYYKKALTLLNGMTERDKLRTLGGYYLSVANNYQDGIETLRRLTASFPGDAAAHTNLSTGYKRVGKMKEAAESSRRAVEISPENLLRRYNYAANSLAAGDLTTALAEAQRIIQKDSTFIYAYLPLALASLLNGDAAKAASVYVELEKINSLGASLEKMGQADLNIYAGRYRDASGILIPAIQTDEKEAHSGELAYKLVALAETYIAMGRNAEAGALAERAVKANALDDGIRFLAAQTLIDAGQIGKAQLLADDLERKLQVESKALALLIRGEIALKQNRSSEAVDAFREARKLHDSWLAHFWLGRAYVEADHAGEALGEFDVADMRASETADLFDANTTSLRYLPPLYYWLGRAQEMLGASEAAHSAYQRYIMIRRNADPVDKLLLDASRRSR